MIRYLISFVKQVMDARVIRLNLLTQQAERKLDIEKCCNTIGCCLDHNNRSTGDRELNYYFHK